MPTRAQNIRLGLFVVATIVLSVLVMVYVGQVVLWRRTRTYYVLAEDSVAGLDEGSRLTMRGVPVGKVESVSLDPSDLGHVIIRLEIDDDIDVPANAHALLQLGGLTGLKQIDIVEGDLDSGVLPPGSEIPLGKTTLEEIEDEATQLAHRANELTAKAEDLLEHLLEIGEGIDADTVARSMTHLEHALANFEKASARVDKAAKGAREDLHTTLGKVDGAADELDELLTRGNRILRNNDDDVRDTMRDVRSAARDLKALVRELRAQPSRLLRSPPPAPRKLP